MSNFHSYVVIIYSIHKQITMVTPFFKNIYTIWNIMFFYTVIKKILFLIIAIFLLLFWGITYVGGYQYRLLHL